MTSFFPPRGFGLGHRDCTRRLLYGMIVYTAGGTRRRADSCCWLLAVGGLAVGELQPRRWPTVGRFQPWAAASEQAEGSGWTKGNTEKEEENNTTTLR